MNNISKTEWKELIEEDKNAVILDVRTPHELREGIIENALMINILEPQSFMSAIEELDKDKNYFVYCRSGVRSVQACQVLESIGIKTTYNLLGGILEWNN
jgi:rhodanese-related sulfurtransferase